MAIQTQAARLAEMLSKAAPTEEECHEIAGMKVARDLHFAPGVVLPPGAFSVPGKADQVVLKSTNLSARHLADLVKWPSFKYLTLEDCRIDETSLAELIAAPNLKGLGLQGTHLTDTGMAQVGQLKTLENLNLERTGLTDAGLAHVAPLTNLDTLSIGQNSITDAGLAALTGLQKLKVLWVNETAVTDAGLTQLTGLPKLRSLNITKSAATESGRDALFAEQEKRKRPAKSAKAAEAHDPAELERIKATLVAFADAMWQWEHSYWANRSMWNTATAEERQWLDEDLKETCRAVFNRYCTDKPRAGFRPDSLSCGDPSDYDPKRRQFESTEFDTGARAFVYAKGIYGRLRYTLVKAFDRWLVDDCHHFRSGRWTLEGL